MTTKATGGSRLFALERQTIAAVSPDQRHGRPRELTAIWFGMNMTPLTLVTGAVATSALGLPLVWAIVAIVVGNLVGGVGMALHAAQGPRLGIPQMIQARGQFGSRGAAVIVGIALLMFVGFFSANLVVTRDAVAEVFPDFSGTAVIWTCVGLSLVAAAVGYRLVRFLTGLSSFLVGIPILLAFGWILLGGGIGKVDVGAGELTVAGFLSMVAIGAVWQLAYAPYVSDYSRYMPAESGGRGAFWGTYIGCVSSTVLLMALGSVLGLAAGDGSIMAAFADLVGGPAAVLLMLFALAAGTGNSVNAYCSMLCALTLVENLRPGWVPSLRARLVTTVVLHLVGLYLAVGAAEDFTTHYYNFVTVLLYVLIPWSAINLADYYLVHRGDYAVADFFRADGGRYGQWNVHALAVYVLGVLVQVPFMVTAFFTGPVAGRLGGIDVAWLVGFVTSGLVYLAVARRRRASSFGATEPVRVES